MAHVIPAKVIYDSEELADILTIAVEGGIGYWSLICDSTRAENLGWLEVLLEPTEEGEGDFPPTWVKLEDIQRAVDIIVSTRDTVNVRKQIVDDICSGEIDKFDSDTGDVLVQFAMFGKLVYG